MRKVMYVVADATGKTFETAVYSEAKLKGNKILSTYLVDIDPRSEQAKKTAKEHAKKIQELRKLGKFIYRVGR